VHLTAGSYFASPHLLLRHNDHTSSTRTTGRRGGRRGRRAHAVSASSQQLHQSPITRTPHTLALPPPHSSITTLPMFHLQLAPRQSVRRPQHRSARRARVARCVEPRRDARTPVSPLSTSHPLRNKSIHYIATSSLISTHPYPSLTSQHNNNPARPPHPHVLKCEHLHFNSPLIHRHTHTHASLAQCTLNYHSVLSLRN
jgi:hypothetical protein